MRMPLPNIWQSILHTAWHLRGLPGEKTKNSPCVLDIIWELRDIWSHYLYQSTRPHSWVNPTSCSLLFQRQALARTLPSPSTNSHESKNLRVQKENFWTCLHRIWLTYDTLNQNPCPTFMWESTKFAMILKEHEYRKWKLFFSDIMDILIFSRKRYHFQEDVLTSIYSQRVWLNYSQTTL